MEQAWIYKDNARAFFSHDVRMHPSVQFSTIEMNAFPSTQGINLMQTLMPSAGNALAGSAETHAAHALKIISAGTAKNKPVTPSPRILHSFASLPPVSTSTAKPAPTTTSSDQQLLNNFVESNLTSSEIIGGSTLLRKLFQPKESAMVSNVEVTFSFRPETHIERVVRESLEAPLDGRKPEARTERVLRQSLTDPLE